MASLYSEWTTGQNRTAALVLYRLNRIWSSYLHRRSGQPLRVFLLGLGKTGTSIAAYRIHAGLSQPKWMDFEPFTFDRASRAEIDRHIEGFVRPSWNLITKCVVHPQRDPEPGVIAEYAKHYDRRIWMARDPRDRMLSDFFYGASWRNAPAGRENEFEGFIRQTIERVRKKERDPKAVPFHTLYADTEKLKTELTLIYAYVSRLEAEVLASWFVLRYEDLVRGSTEALNEYLGIRVDMAAEVPSFFRRVTRTRGYANWRDWFTPDDVAFFRPLFEDYLRESGYDAEDWELNEDPKLDPKLGSEYMEQLLSDRSL